MLVHDENSPGASRSGHCPPLSAPSTPIIAPPPLYTLSAQNTSDGYYSQNTPFLRDSTRYDRARVGLWRPARREEGGAGEGEGGQPTERSTGEVRARVECVLAELPSSKSRAPAVRRRERSGRDSERRRLEIGRRRRIGLRIGRFWAQMTRSTSSSAASTSSRAACDGRARPQSDSRPPP